MRIPLLLYGLAFVVRAILMLQFPDPAYPNSAYYVDVARSLAAGHGLNVDFVWIFAEVGGHIPANPVLPVPSNAHWLPLASFIQAPFIVALGPTAIASALPMVLIGSLLAPLTWLIARDAGATPTVQLGAGVLGAIPAAGTVFMAQPENFAVFGPLVAACLWLAARGLRGDGRSFAVAGLLAGLACIGRNDAYFLGIAVGLTFFFERWRARRRGVPSVLSFRAAVGCVVLFFVVVGPWWLRQLATFGSISPTASTGNALWLTDIRQWNSITADVSFQAWLDQGLGAIIASRLGGLVSSIANFSVFICSVVLVPFVVWGAWRRRHSDAFLTWFLYAGLLFGAATLLFPLHVPGGAFIHSAVGLAPGAYIFGLEGVAAMVAAIGRRRPAWREGSATAVFTWAVVGFLIATAVLYAPVVRAGWAQERDRRVALETEMERLGVPATDRLMTIDAGGYMALTGRPGVVSPDDPIDTIAEVARAYDIQWLVLERDGVVEALKPVLDGGPRPEWIGAPVFSIPAADGGTPDLALYPVCPGPDLSLCTRTTASVAP